MTKHPTCEQCKWYEGLKVRPVNEIPKIEELCNHPAGVSTRGYYRACRDYEPLEPPVKSRFEDDDEF